MVLWSELAPAQTKAGGEGSGTAAAAAPKASGTQPSAGTAGASGTAPPAGSPGAEAAKAPGAAPPAAPSPAAAPPAAAPGATATAPTAAGTAGAVDGGTYVVRLRDLEMRIDELKEQIRRSHTRLSLLSDTILSGGVGGARAVITFKNELSGAFRLTGAVFVLDGVVQFNRQDDSETGLLANQKEIPIFSGSIPPGDHTLQVVLRLRGHGYGVFSYLRGYKFEIPSGHSFTVGEGKTVSLDVVAWEKGDVTTPVEQRPAVRYAESIKTGVTGPAAPARSTAAKPAPAAPAAGGAVRAGASGGASIGAGTK